VTDAATDEAPAAQQSANSARRAGRGFVSIAGAKLYFLIAGYVSQLYLPVLLGNPEVFGLFSTALSLVSILNNVIVTANIQVVSKRVSEDPQQAPYIVRQALELQILVAGAIGGTMVFAAPWLARSLLDPLLTPLFRLAGVIVVAYALYATLIGALNGKQDFLGQARFDMGYTTLRTGLMLVAAATGYGAVGVIGGFALASVSVLLAAATVVGTGRSGGRTAWSTWFRFMGPLWLYQLCNNLILQIDVTLLKRTVAALLQAHGVQALEAAETASRYVGFYRAAQTFAFVPYQLIISVAFVVFPMVSEALSLGDEAAAQRYIRAALRFSLLVLLAIAAPLAGAPEGVMRFVYPPAYVAGAPALAILALGTVAFALFVIGATIMTGAGRPGTAAIVGLLAVGGVVAGNLGLVQYVGVGDRTLVAAACGTTIGTTIAFIAIGVSVYMRFGAFIPVLTALRALIAAGAAFMVAHAIPVASKPMCLVALAAGGIAYLLVLALLREVTRADLAPVLRRRR
jgi:stage V sporulation protein B